MKNNFLVGFDEFIKEAITGETLAKHLDTIGLTTLMAPAVHSLFSAKEETPTTHKLKAGAEIAGLGLLLPKATELAKKVFKAKG